MWTKEQVFPMNNVVARFKDGRVLKGTSLAVDPSKPAFPLRPANGKAVEVPFRELKALFFVRSLEGNASHNEASTPVPGDPRMRGSTQVKLKFEDGEVLVGLVNAYPPARAFFFMNPVDTRSNNIRVLVNRAAVTSMQVVESSERSRLGE
jgi:hypothetical protein